MIKVLIADDHSIFRSGLKKILKEEKDMAVTAEASNHQEVLSSLSSGLPDLVLLDISMPGTDGLETLKQIKLRYPKQKVLMLSMHPEDRYAVRAMKGGAWGYVSKENTADELVHAIRRVSSGLKHISATLAGKIASFIETDLEKSPDHLLSDREFQVISGIASGKSIIQIGEDLSLSPSTVATYRARALKKLQLESDLQVACHLCPKN